MAGLLYNDIWISIVFLAWTILTCRTVKGGLPSGFENLSVTEYSVMMANTNINSQHTKGVAECNFDNGLCDFYNEKKGDNFDWVLRRGATPSGNTGPRRDLSGKGYYIYIEASSPRRLGHKAIFSSPVLSGMVYCLQFGFHAYGKNIGALVVYKKDFNKTETEELFKLEKDHGKKWQYIVGTVVHPNSFQIEFEGVVGRGYTGDIALDNIRITQGRCRIARNNNTEECGFGYPGFSSVFSGLQGYINWPWLVELSASGKSKPLCSAARVGNDWLITSKKCVKKFAKMHITIYQGKINIGRRRTVVKIHEHPSLTSEAVLLQLNKTTSKGVKDKVCLPRASISTQTLVEKCLLLATSFSGYIRDFVESKVTIISMKKCEPYLQTARWTHQDKKQLLCIQLDPHHNINRTRLASDGYIVCENKIIRRWILHAVGPVSYPKSNTKLLIFTKVSTVVDWMEKLINISIRVPKMRSLLRPKRLKAPVKGFQMFEQIKQKCLTFLSKASQFRYETCDLYNIFQRFEWSTDGLPHIVIPGTKYCLTTDFYKLKSLRVARCQANKRSQNWICMRNMLFNGFHKTYFLSFASEEESAVRLSKDPEWRGRFVIYGTEDSLCSLRQTVKGVFRCSYSLDPSCGFKSTDNTQFKWIFRTPSWGDLKYFTMLLSSDTFFQVFRRVWRGSRTAVIRSPLFNGVRCVEFRSFLYGLSDDQLLFYKSDGGAKELLLRIGAEKEKRWRFHRITVHSSHCETYQVLFKAILPTSGNAKFGIHDIQVFPGPCGYAAKQTEGQCLKGWTFFNGSCFYAFNFTTTWHQALAVCQITGADLPTDIAVSRLYHHRSAVWFGVRSCPNGQFYSTQAIRYRHQNTPVASQTCLQLQMATGKSPTHRSSSCDLKLPFACQKDPKKTETGCGLRNTSLANDRQWPWHVIIVMFRNCICSGTLISPGYVVTSTLCVTGVRMQDVKIFIPSSRTIVHKVTNIISHPKSGLKSGHKDIAILIFDHVVLSSPSSIRFACLNEMTTGWKETKSSKNELLKDTKCVVLGWGTYRGGRFTCGPRRYKVREVKIVEKKECEEYYGKDKITEEMLCVSPRTRSWYRICHGDTGGPLVCDIAGAWTLVGITTWGVDCAATRKYGIYTDVASMRHWIDYVITEQKNKETLQ